METENKEEGQGTDQQDVKHLVIEIPQKEWEMIRVIAKKVGGDFGMEVKLGKPGGGSHFNNDSIEIILDPLCIIESSDRAKFLPGHEGAHRAISPSPLQIGLSKRETEELFSQIGFAYLHNIIEDPAVDDWLAGRFPGIEPIMKRLFDEDISEEENVVLTSEAIELTRLLGYFPKFVQYGAEIIRNWHRGEILEDLDPDVKRALDRTLEFAEESIDTIPDSQGNDHDETVDTARRRFEINTEYIWPEFKKLVEQDINTEAIRQMVNEALERLEEIEEKKDELDDAKKNGDSERQKELEREIEELERGLQSFKGLGVSITDEIKRKAQKARRDLEKEKDQDLDKSPLPLNLLSEESKKAIQEMFDNLSGHEKRRYRESAKRKLEDLEDELNRELQGKLVQDRPESHHERREREERERRSLQEEERLRQLARALEQQRRARMTDYDRAYEEVADIIDGLYIRLKRFLMPERHPRWRSGYPAGQRVDLGKAMQIEKDPKQLRSMWMKKTVPHKLDYRFLMLVDLSGSMLGGPLDETFKGVVVLVEVLEKLWIPNEVIGFSDRPKTFKGWDVKLDRESREGLNEMRDFAGGTTNTSEATRRAVSELERNSGRNDFLITLTDGAPNDPDGLKALLGGIEDERRIKLVGIGLGPETQYVKDYYRASLSLETLKPTEKEKREGAREFSEVFADLLEDIIMNPGNY